MYKITEDFVAKLRAQRRAGATLLALSKQYDMGRQTIRNVLSGKRAAEVDKPKPIPFVGMKPPKIDAKPDKWCDECGCMVVDPCFLCAVRERKRTDESMQRKWPDEWPHNVPIAEMIRSQRIVNRLDEAGHVYVGDLGGLGEDDLLAIWQIDTSAVKIIRKSLRALIKAGPPPKPR